LNAGDSVPMLTSQIASLIAQLWKEQIVQQNAIAFGIPEMQDTAT
jgi:hypothetical protein